MEEMTLRVPVAVKAKVTDDLKAKIGLRKTLPL